jgi:hypothetical protein
MKARDHWQFTRGWTKKQANLIVSNTDEGRQKGERLIVSNTNEVMVVVEGMRESMRKIWSL